MKNDPSLNSALAGIYRTAVTVSALIISLSASVAYAADPLVPRSNVSVNVNPTTSYYTATNSTLRLPNGVSTAPTSGALPVVTKYSGGLQQTIPMGVTIDAIKKSAPLPAVVRSSVSTLKGAATRCLTSAKCNVGLILAGEGLNRLFDGLDWVMGEGGKIQKTEYSLSSPPAEYIISTGARFNPAGPSALISTGSQRPMYCPLTTSNPLLYLIGGVQFNDSQGNCYYGPSGSTPNPTNVSDSEISSGVDSNYTPEPSDWRALTPEMQPDDIEITWAPTLEGEPKTTTVYDADGNPYKVTETNIWYDFDIRGNPSPQPALDLKIREETKTYENGELTSTTTTESTASSGSGSTPETPPESPIDCDLFPTACAWFDWTQEEPVEPDTDLSGLLQEVPIVSETYTITGGVAACPAPMVLDLSVFGSREVSYQPLCDLASTMKFLYLALMSFAAAVLLNRSINRV